MSDSAVSISALILAGGHSSRMGQDKALLCVEGVPLLWKVCHIARQCSDRVYVVTPWIDRYQPIFNPETGSGSPSVEWIQETYQADETSPHGPLVGFAQGLKQVQTDWVLLLACDLPHLQPETLQAWVAQLPTLSSEIVALVPQHPQGWWEPLSAFYRRQCLVSLEQYIDQGGRSFQRWLAQQTVQKLLPSDPQILFNCNTPQDFARISP